jgi:hypothetical protein
LTSHLRQSGCGRQSDPTARTLFMPAESKHLNREIGPLQRTGIPSVRMAPSGARFYGPWGILVGTAMQAKSGASYRKQRPGPHSNRYRKGVVFAPPSSRHTVPGTRFFSDFSKINRDILLIESPVSHRKQRTGARINRNISSTSQTGATRQ